MSIKLRAWMVAALLLMGLAPLIGLRAQDEIAVPAAVAGKVELFRPWARATASGSDVAAVFMELKSGKGGGDRLIGGSTPLAALVELHDYELPGSSSATRRIASVRVPAGGAVVLKPGSYHLVLKGLKVPLAAGGRLQITLNFEQAGAVTLDVPILHHGAMGPEAAPRLKSKQK